MPLVAQGRLLPRREGAADVAMNVSLADIRMILAFPLRILFISVPASFSPAVNSSSMKNSKRARLFLIFTSLDANYQIMGHKSKEQNSIFIR
jgi:hypothetical protein